MGSEQNANTPVLPRFTLGTKGKPLNIDGLPSKTKKTKEPSLESVNSGTSEESRSWLNDDYETIEEVYSLEESLNSGNDYKLSLADNQSTEMETSLTSVESLQKVSPNASCLSRGNSLNSDTTLGRRSVRFGGDNNNNNDATQSRDSLMPPGQNNC